MSNDNTKPSVSQRLAAWGATLAPDDLPPATLAKSRDILVDIVGLCISARGTDYVAAAKAAAEPGDHIIVGHAERIDDDLLRRAARHRDAEGGGEGAEHGGRVKAGLMDRLGTR